MRTSNPTTYSNDFKNVAVQKLLSPGSPGLNATAENLGIPPSTLYGWKKEYANKVDMKKNKTGSWTPEQKLQIIVETASMPEHELGEYLRAKGIHSTELSEWKSIFYNAQASAGRPKKDPELFELRKDKKDLQRELRRKDKALAEMSARVILLKKSHEIFGGEEDDE